MYNNHLRQAIYGDIHILGQILLNWFGEVTKNYWQNYTIFRANVAKQLLGHVDDDLSILSSRDDKRALEPSPV